MKFVNDDVSLLLQEMQAEEFAATQISKAADEYAREFDQTNLDISELDPANCPPDRRYQLGEREAWVYEHGNISELVFVNLT